MFIQTSYNDIVLAVEFDARDIKDPAEYHPAIAPYTEITLLSVRVPDLGYAEVYRDLPIQVIYEIEKDCLEFVEEYDRELEAERKLAIMEDY